MDTAYSIEDLEVFEDVLSAAINNLYSKKNSTSHLEANVLQAIKEELKHILSNCNFDTNLISNLLHSKGWTEDKVKCFLKLLNENRNRLLYYTFIYHNSSYGESVTTFDWNMKYIFGSSDLKALRYPLLQLVFTTMNSKGQEDGIGCEVPKNVLAKLIDVLESGLK